MDPAAAPLAVRITMVNVVLGCGLLWVYPLIPALQVHAVHLRGAWYLHSLVQNAASLRKSLGLFQSKKCCSPMGWTRLWWLLCLLGFILDEPDCRWNWEMHCSAQLSFMQWRAKLMWNEVLRIMIYFGLPLPHVVEHPLKPRN